MLREYKFVLLSYLNTLENERMSIQRILEKLDRQQHANPQQLYNRFYQQLQPKKADDQQQPRKRNQSITRSRHAVNDDTSFPTTTT